MVVNPLPTDGPFLSHQGDETDHDFTLLQVHEKRKDHKCNMCDKVFARRDTLKR